VIGPKLPCASDESANIRNPASERNTGIRRLDMSEFLLWAHKAPVVILLSYKIPANLGGLRGRGLNELRERAAQSEGSKG
jgi:hypothetical protein